MTIESQNKIAAKIQQMLKTTIVDAGLVRTGHMRDSISVTPNSGGYNLSAIHYFPYVNSRYNMTRWVMNSTELKVFIEKIIQDEFKAKVAAINVKMGTTSIL